MALSADHGVSPVPEYMHALSLGGSRMTRAKWSRAWRKRSDRFWQRHSRGERRIHGLLFAPGVSKLQANPAAMKAALDAIAATEGVWRVFNSEELERKIETEDLAAHAAALTLRTVVVALAAVDEHPDVAVNGAHRLWRPTPFVHADLINSRLCWHHLPPAPPSLSACASTPVHRCHRSSTCGGELHWPSGDDNHWPLTEGRRRCCALDTRMLSARSGCRTHDTADAVATWTRLADLARELNSFGWSAFQYKPLQKGNTNTPRTRARPSLLGGCDVSSAQRRLFSHFPASSRSIPPTPPPAPAMPSPVRLPPITTPFGLSLGPASALVYRLVVRSPVDIHQYFVNARTGLVDVTTPCCALSPSSDAAPASSPIGRR